VGSIGSDSTFRVNSQVGVPGAFTPACSSQVPGYISNFEKFAAKGVQGIYVVAVNDVFVTKAWKEKLASSGTCTSLASYISLIVLLKLGLLPAVHFIADDKGVFSSAVGLIFDASPLLGGPRAKAGNLSSCQSSWLTCYST
jgi:peroxiredoxin